MVKKSSPRSKNEVPATKGIESFSVPEPVYEEERYDLDEDDRLIQYEMNLIELPMFTRDDRIGASIAKRYVFAKNIQMEILPSSDKLSGFKIPQEFDEKIFLAVLRLYRKYKNRRIVTTIYDLLKLAGFGDSVREYERAKQSLIRLQDTVYIFNNILYDAEKKVRMSGTTRMNILQYGQIVRVEDLKEADRKEYDKREKRNVKEVAVIVLTDFIEKNIIAKGYLSYDADKLIEIDQATARKIYLLIEKWRGWENSDIIRRPCKFLASRIPLSWEDKNVSGSIGAIERAAAEIKKKGLIGDYQLERKTPLKDSEIVFFFEGAEQTARMKAIRQHNKELAVRTGHEDLQITEVSYDARQATIFDVPGKDPVVEPVADVVSDLDRLMAEVPEACRTRTVQELVRTYLKKKGFEYVASTIAYTKQEARDFNKLFPAALEKDFGEKLRLARAEEARVREEKRQEAEAKRREDEKEQQAALAFKTWWEGLTEMQQELADERAKEMMKAAGLGQKATEMALPMYRKKVFAEWGA